MTSGVPLRLSGRCGAVSVVGSSLLQSRLGQPAAASWSREVRALGLEWGGQPGLGHSETRVAARGELAGLVERRIGARGS